ncbi:unnamed protein product [Anisakis simplex]|uniref:Uncharacterized protein n=1 Tax=Anisakis simplex TaxID=6269 RepID=A0A0M3K3I9_ANISI|nr:unnamed protein product [Anisakis simplex]
MYNRLYIQEDDLFDLDSLCYHESPSVDDECASVSATSSSSSSSPFFRQTSLIDHGISESDQHSEISDCTTRLSSSLSLEKGMSVCSNDDVDNEVNEQASGALNGSLGTGIGWNPFRRASAMASIGLRRQHSINAKEPDTVSDESGYQDGTISHSDDEGILAEQDEGDFAEDEYDIQVTAL